MTGATPDETVTAYGYGAVAARAGATRVPGADQDLMDLIGPVPVGQPRTLALMRAWTYGHRDETIQTTEQVVLCPDCSSANLTGPDDEGFLDCLECGAAWIPGKEA